MNRRHSITGARFLTRSLLLVTVACSLLLSAETTRRRTRSETPRLPGWRTNTAKRTIELHELKAGGPGKDGIPAIHRPAFVEPERAARGIGRDEPVIALEVGGQSKAYPLQILMWHEIVNDTIGDVPVAVTFCPLCYSADVFDRRVDDKVLSFGVSGFLRFSNMIMYDRQTETFWQQALGEAVVGDRVGSSLRRLPAQIISFAQFREAYPTGVVLSRRTGHNRPYGRNPYVGYDSVSQNPLTVGRSSNKGLLPRERLVTVSVDGRDKAYPYFVTRRQGAINDEVGGVPLVIFHGDGAVSALDRERIAASREVGSTGVFERRLGDEVLTFKHEDGQFHDEQTQSTWDITGKAVAGPLKGQRLTPVAHGDYFAFSWLVFKPDTGVYRPAAEKP